MKQGAKAIFFAADKQPVVIVVPGDRKIDTRVFEKQYGVKDLQMLKSEEVTEFTGLEIGAVPPLGNVMKLPTYVDEAVLANNVIFFNAGSHTRSVKMKPQDFVNLCRPEIGVFSKPV